MSHLPSPPVSSPPVPLPRAPHCEICTDKAMSVPLPPLHFTKMWKMFQVPIRVGSTLAYELNVQGHKNVPQTGGVLLLANHQSNLDPPIVGVRMLRPCCFLAKSELFENRFFSWFIRSFNAFPVRQGKGDVGAMKQSIRLLESGHALMMFPEGRRTKDGQLQRLEPGVGLIVRKTKVPVVPVALDGTFQAWPIGASAPRTGRVRVRFGKPIYGLHKLDARSIMDRAAAEIASLFETIRFDKNP